MRTEKLTNKILNLSQFLWKKRVLLLRKKFFNTLKEKFILSKLKAEINNNKIEILYYDLKNKPKNIIDSNVILIGLDGLIKYESEKLDLKKIFMLISKMPMSNY